MKKVVIIADDFTGALDTGVQFAERNIPTTVTQRTDADIGGLFQRFQVVVVDTESRHMAHNDAYKLVHGVAHAAAKAGADIIYKKTDSALRGNIGAELKAVSDMADGSLLCFAAAFPAAKRVTSGGYQYTDGVLISESGFGRDPVDPVTESFIPAIINSQAPSLACTVISKEELYGGVPLKEMHGVAVFDASEDDDLAAIADHIAREGCISYLAGCAGFAKQLEALIEAPADVRRSFHRTDKLIVLCGSVNPITREQIEYAENNGFVRIDIKPEMFLTAGYLGSPEGTELLHDIYSAVCGDMPVMVCTMDEHDDDSGRRAAQKLGIRPADMADYVSSFLGGIGRFIIESGTDCTFAVTGGDTLAGFLKAAGGTELSPVCEIGSGTVLSVMHDESGHEYQVVSKSGGFGEREIFVRVAEQVLKSFNSKAVQ